jgi:hypothetical protein
MYTNNNNNYLHHLNCKKDVLKSRYISNPSPSTLFDILNILKEINSLKAKIYKE